MIPLAASQISQQMRAARLLMRQSRARMEYAFLMARLGVRAWI
jgi:hypothetical protein